MALLRLALLTLTLVRMRGGGVYIQVCLLTVHFLVTVGKVTVTDQYLASITKESSEFESDPADGLLGLGLAGLSNLGHVSRFDY